MTESSFLQNGRRGYALILVMILTAVVSITLAAIMRRSMTTAHLNERSNQRTVNLNAAEAATEKAMAEMVADYRVEGEVRLNTGLTSYRRAIPTSEELPYWSGFEFSDNLGHVGKIDVTCVSNTTYQQLESQYAGLNGFASVYRITACARQTNTTANVPTAVQQEIQLAEIPVFQFAIFYNSLLEFTWAAPFTIRGRVHSNGSIYTGSACDLDFKAAVTSTGTIEKKAWDGYNLSQMTGGISYEDGKATNAPSLTLPIGTNNTSDAVREILEIPPVGESIHSDMGEQRFYNKAEMLILVDDTGITAQVKQPYDDTPLTIPTEQLSAFLSTDQEFTDQREGKKVSVTQVDIGAFGDWAKTNSYVASKLGAGQPPTILYVADDRTYTTNGTVELAGVRLVNGDTLPTRGLTTGTRGLSVATPNPLYVLGNYNCPNSSYLNTTNTSDTEPASLISDALTVLSSNWDDSKSAQSFTYRRAANTTINAAIVTGMIYSQGSDGSSPFSGGVMNITRLLEDWGNGTSTKLTLNTSIVNLFESARATAPFQSPGNYYYAPIRDFNFDPNFTDPLKLPPGTPRVRAEIRVNWSTPAPQS